MHGKRLHNVRNPQGGNPGGWAGLFAAIAEDTRGKPLSQVSDKNLFKQLSSVFNPKSSYTLGDFVDGEAVGDSHQTQGAAASSSQSAPSADLEDFVQGFFGGPHRTNRTTTDKVETEILKGLGKLGF